MATIDRASGIRITSPDHFEVESEGAESEGAWRGGRPRSGRALGSARADAAQGDHSTLLGALAREGLELVDEVRFVATAGSQRRGARPAGSLAGARGRGAPRDDAMEDGVLLEVPLDTADAAVVLAEQDGVFSWVFPEPEPTHRARGGRPLAGGHAGQQQKTFILTARTATDGAAGAAPRPRGARGPGTVTLGSLMQTFVLGRVRAWILRFAAGRTVEGLARLQERGVVPGLVLMSHERDVGAWQRIERIDSLGLPADRPARLLLFVHGTFSSTHGSFGALSATDEGRALLRASGDAYDAVIGFDHATLSLDPRENARDLLARLRGVSLAPQIDAVAFSRGGLVLRALFEELLPTSTWKPQVGRAIFVGCTHGGTELARPANWHALVDLYTNLALAASRLVGLVPQARGVAEIMAEGVRYVGDFVKYLAETGTDEQRVPGLAAMVPDSDLVRALAGPRTMVADGSYQVVTSNFNTSARLAAGTGAGLPARLIQVLADGLIDQVMGAGNDLVVDVRSMGALSRDLVGARYDLGDNADVYHTVYFGHPEIARQVAGWLALATKAEERPGS